MSDLNVAVSSPGLIGLESDKTQAEVPIKDINVNKMTLPSAVKEEAKESKDEKEVKEPSHQEVEVALSEVNAFVQSMQRNLSFTIDEQLGQEIISVTDTETQEVIRQIPSEELVVLRKKMDDVVGILFDTKV